MLRPFKTYINVVLLSMAAIFIVPFSWLHQCEYTHSHSAEKPTETPFGSFNEEILSCSICELNFPAFLSGEYESIETVKGISVEFKPFFNASTASSEYLFSPLRAPPFC